MTRNQIAYQEYVERKRANEAGERLTGARDAETARSNREQERLTSERQAEQRRANLANEAETNRSNLAREFETNRANLAKEQETYRANIEREKETARANQAREAEEQRSNLARELETNRANVVKEQEEHRSNLADEIERNRHNVESEYNQVYSADRGYDSRVDSYAISAEASKYATDARSNQAALDRFAEYERTQMQTDMNYAIEQLRQEGLNDRQARQIVADAINVLHDDIVKLLSSDSGKRSVKDLIWNWTLKSITK